jgi:shikimate kinase
MPGAGKSTVGVILARMAGCDFVDTDVLIQTAQGRTLQDIVDTDGYAVLRRIEEDILLGLRVRDNVIATGGSAVYSDRAMAHLKADGVVVFLDVDLATLERRVSDFSTRGLAKRPDQSFTDLFNERFALYTEHADITIKCDDLTHEQVCQRIFEEGRGIGSSYPYSVIGIQTSRGLDAPPE